MSTHSTSLSYDSDFNPWSRPFCQTSVPSAVAPPSPTPCLGTKHQYTLRGIKGNVRPWLSLVLASRSPKPELLPLFVGKDVISGAVELDLPKPETIREVRIAIKGESTHLTQESSTFLEVSQTLASPPGKLSGQVSYPFKFVLPEDVTIYESNWAMVYPVPPRFHEKGIIYIDYKVVVTSGVRFLLFSRDDCRAAVHSPRKGLFESLLRSDIPTPMLDPGGWKLLPSVKAVLVPNTAVTLQLSIANPLSFALGTPIPLFLEVRNDKATYFDPESIDIRLVRALATRGLTGGVRKLDVARAVLWPAQGSSLHSTKLWGEILLEKCLTPSFDFSNCSVRYSIVLYPRHTPDRSEREPLLSEEVLLTLRKAVGVVPRPQAPPGVIPQPIEHKRSVTTRPFFAY
ncbi:hypothetical protein EDB85DRAFT_2139761 [Lactarius pseudohatsudake]|nr:hypothetical protein EDB85DRAFT_2139761 [Lactarius pseudohatsudake]